MSLTPRSKWITAAIVALSVWVGMEFSKYSTNYGAVAILVMYVSLVVIVKGFEKLRHS